MEPHEHVNLMKSDEHVNKNLRPMNTNRGLKNPYFVFIGLSVGVGGLWVMVVGGGDPGGEEGRRGRARYVAAMLS